MGEFDRIWVPGLGVDGAAAMRTTGYWRLAVIPGLSAVIAGFGLLVDRLHNGVAVFLQEVGS